MPGRSSWKDMLSNGEGEGAPPGIHGLEDFEQSRRQMETQNELRNQRATVITIVALMMGFLLNNLYEWTSFRPSSIWWQVMVAGLCVASFVSWYLAKPRPYQSHRKYLLTLWDALLVTAAFASLRENLHPLVFALAPVPVYLMMVVHTGLKYSRKLTVLAGVLAVLLFAAVFLPVVQASLGLAIGLEILIITAAITAATVRTVESLTTLHYESVWRERLQRFLPSEVVQEVARNPSLLNQRTERREATVLFADLRGFSTMCETRPPEEVVRILNLFLEEMTSSILGARGMLLHYFGDGVLGVFGAPLGLEDHAAAALQAAEEMLRRVDALNRKMAAADWPALGVGVGIHTGQLVTGAIGTRERLEYTVIGDTVNVAARVERLTRTYEVGVVCTQATRDALRHDAPLRFLDRVQVKGRAEPVSVWTLEPALSASAGGDSAASQTLPTSTPGGNSTG